MRFFLKSIDV
jgi:hypothetical protein